jgi:hypothetical protein
MGSTCHLPLLKKICRAGTTCPGCAAHHPTRGARAARSHHRCPSVVDAARHVTRGWKTTLAEEQSLTRCGPRADARRRG